MPDTPYTIKNMMDIDNAVGDRAPGVEGRFGRSQIDSEHLGISHFRYAPGTRSPMAHSHRVQEEVYVVVAGSGRVRLDDEVLPLSRWDILRVSPPVVRAFEAGDDGLELIAAGSDRPADGDGVPSEQAWIDE
jgi:mannose-6-phosphate isomerase-like protein (cupin superfamily)